MDDTWIRYAEEFTSAEGELLAELRRHCYEHYEDSSMLSGFYQGRLLSMFSRMIRPRVVLEVELVARALLEGAAPVGSNLAGHPVRAKKREGTARGGAARQLEVHPDATAAAQMDAARPTHERGELGQSAAGLARFDRRKLLPDVLRKAQSSTPSRASRRRLYSTPSEP